MRLFCRLLCLALWCRCIRAGRVLDFLQDLGGIPSDSSFEACQENSQRFTNALQWNASGQVLRFPCNTTFHFHHGILGDQVNDTILQIDGTLRFERADLEINHLQPFPACITVVNSRNFTITSNDRGLIDGRGSQWWGIPGIGYLETAENRPRLLRFNLTEDLLIEKVTLQDSPYHTLFLDSVNRVEVRNMSIVARRTAEDGHSWVDLTAFNTDGIDVSGTNVWIHDVDIWVQDDCIAVKDVRNHTEHPVPFISANMTFERINATGLGFVIGSIQATHVRNITFRDSYLHKPLKGIYLKFASRNRGYLENNMTALVEDIHYENITIMEPTQWPIWIGPAQQADNRNPCHPNPCSLCWPMTLGSKCNVVPRNKFRNITLKNIIVHNPVMSTGVILGNDGNPIENIVFDNVRVTKGLPPLIARRPLNENFPGTRLPVHDPFVPSYTNKVERRITGIAGLYWHVVSLIGHLIQSLVERVHISVFLQFLETQNGAQKWYISYLLKALLDTVWVWIVLAVGFCVTGGFAYRGWLRYRRRVRDLPPPSEDTEESADEPLLPGPRHRRYPPFLCHMGYITLLLICFGGALYTGTFPFRKPKWERTYRYYACESVVGGVARGGTWPVPACFKRERPWWHNDDDEDDKNGHNPFHRRRRRSKSFSPHKVDVHVERLLATAAMVLAVVGLAFWKHWRDRVPEESPSEYITLQACQDGEETHVADGSNTTGEEADEANHMDQLVEDYVDPLASPNPES
jgi:hypothetical protein